MTNPPIGRKFDLQDRTLKFGQDIIVFCRKIARSPINDPLVTQLVKCGTSVGANYAEADDAESREDFRHKIGICKKESRESKHFVSMLAAANPQFEEIARGLQQEAKELNLIFNAIYKKVK